MRNKSFLILVLTLCFVGATSCGEDEMRDLEAKNSALQEVLRQQQGRTVTAVTTATTTATITRTETHTTTRTATATSGSTATSISRE